MRGPRARVDANQREIVAAARKLGASVRSLAMVGDGMPDVLIGYQGNNYLVEVKDGSKPPSARKLTPDEEEFWQEWKGQVAMVESVADLVTLLTSGETLPGHLIVDLRPDGRKSGKKKR